MALIRFLDRTLFRGVSVAAQVLVMSAVAAAFYQVLARFVLETPADWSEAWTRAALIWTVMLGIILAFRQGAMLSVEMLHGFLGARNKRGLEHVIMAINVGFLGFMAWVGVQMTWRVRFQNVPSLDVSISWIYVAIPIGAMVAIVAVIARWAERPQGDGIDDSSPM
ncbi:MAG: TRAP transporter small permease subunit [Burkholderiaceae bacterium]